MGGPDGLGGRIEMVKCLKEWMMKRNEITAKELLERYAAGERNFSGVWIRQANLINVDLRDINLSNSKLIEAQLIGAKLNSAILNQIYLEGADLTSATLCGANLTRADLSGCQLVRTNFTDANLSEAGLWDACLDGAFFVGVNLQQAHLVGTTRYGTCFNRADLRESTFECVDGAADFTDANLKGVSEFVALKTDTFCRTTMPDGSIRNDGCWPDRAEYVLN